MICDRQLISAYYDDLLEPDVREELTQHLAICDECRRTLSSYRGFGTALASIAAPPVPSSLRVRFNRSLDHSALPQFGLGLVGPFGALAAAALVFVVVASFAARPSSTALAVVAAYPRNGATGVLLDDAIAVEFNSPIESDALGDLQIRLEPPVPIETTILGSKVVLRPIIPLRPDTQYVVRIERSEKSNASNQIVILPPPPTAAPLTVNFSTGRAVAPAASATAAARGNNQASPSPAPALALLPPPPATPTARPSSAPAVPVATSAARPETSAAALVSTRTPPPASCGTATSSRVAFVLRGRSELLTRLGCAAAAERVVTYDEPPSDTGLQIAVDDGRSLVTLLPDGRWLTAVATATPTPARPIASNPPPAATPLAAGPSGASPTATPGSAGGSALATSTAPAVTPSTTVTDAAGSTSSPTPSPAASVASTAVSTVTAGEASPRPKGAGDLGTSAVQTVIPSASPTASAVTTVNSTATPGTRPNVLPTTSSSPTTAASSGRPLATTAASAEPLRFAWVQVFEHGSVLLAPAADGGLGYVLLEDGTWSRLAAFSPRPIATATATPKSSSTPTLAPDAVPAGMRDGQDRDAIRTGEVGAQGKGAGEPPAPLAFIRGAKRSA